MPSLEALGLEGSDAPDPQKHTGGAGLDNPPKLEPESSGATKVAEPEKKTPSSPSKVDVGGATGGGKTDLDATLALKNVSEGSLHPRDIGAENYVARVVEVSGKIGRAHV